MWKANAFHVSWIVFPKTEIQLDDLKERRGYSHLKEEALDRTMCTARFGRGFGPVVRQTTKGMTDFVDTMISRVLRDLHFIRNQPMKSAND